MTKAIPILLIIMLPFFVWGRSILQGQMNGLLFIAFLAAVCFIQNNWLRMIGAIAVGWLAIAYAVGFVGAFPTAAFVDSSLIILLGIAVYLIIYYTDFPFSFYATIICISALIQSIIGVFQYYWFDPISSLLSIIITVEGIACKGTIVGSLGNSNFLGAYLALSLPFFFRPKWFWLIPVIGLGLYAAHSTTAFICVIIGTAYYLFGLGGIALGIIPAVIYLVGFSGKELISNDRISFWIDAIQKVCHSPSSFIFGYGQGTTWQQGNQLHSEYIATFFNYGAAGLASMIGYISTINRGQKILFTAFIILCINMIANHPLHAVTTAILAITIISLMDRENRRILSWQ